MNYQMMVYTGTGGSNLYYSYYDGRTWIGNQLVQTGDGKTLKSASAAGLTTFKDTTYILYQDDNSQELQVSSYNPSDYWTDPIVITDSDGNAIIPVGSPDLISFGGMLVSVYADSASKDLYMATSLDGQNWEVQAIQDMNGSLSPQSSANPAMAALEGYLFIIYKGRVSNSLYLARFEVTDTGGEWIGNQKIVDMSGSINAQSDISPAAANSEDQLIIMYKEPNSKNLCWATYHQKAWTGGNSVSISGSSDSAQSDQKPALYYNGTNFHAIYKAGSSSDLYTAWSDGETWYGDIKMENLVGDTEVSVLDGPQLVRYNGSAGIIYPSGSTSQLFTCWFNGSTWFGNTPIQNQGGNLNVRSDKSPGAIEFEGQLLLLYKAASSTDLYSATFQNGIWSGNQTIDVNGHTPRSSATPALATDGKTVYALYKAGASEDLYFATYDGTTWSGDTQVKNPADGNTVQTSAGPAATVWDNQLVVVYKDSYSNLKCCWMDLDSATWTMSNSEIATSVCEVDTDASPSLFKLGDKLYVSFQENKDSSDYSGGNTVAYTEYLGNGSWGGTTWVLEAGDSDPRTDTTPRFLPFTSGLLLVWKEVGLKSLSYCQRVDGSWGTEKELKQVGTATGAETNTGLFASPIARLPQFRTDWMSTLSGDTLMTDISLPCTHDSGSISGIAKSHFEETDFTEDPFAWAKNKTLDNVTLEAGNPGVTQNFSITNQLKHGIRGLDIRLSITESSGTYSFTVCHGDLIVAQPFEDVLQECQDFLEDHPNEALIMSLKVDNWNDLNKSDATNALEDFVADYDCFNTKASIQTLQQVRGKIYLFNRIAENTSLGNYVSWSDNTTGQATTTGNDISLYVQDYYEYDDSGNSSETWIEQKRQYFQGAYTTYNQTGAGFLWNFASGANSMGFIRHANKPLLRDLKKAANRPAKLGWTFMDFPFTPLFTSPYGDLDLPTMVIASNFGYYPFEGNFKTSKKGKDLKPLVSTAP